MSPADWRQIGKADWDTDFEEADWDTDFDRTDWRQTGDRLGTDWDTHYEARGEGTATL